MAGLSDPQRALLRGALETLASELQSLHESSADGAAPVDLDAPIGRLSRIDAIAQQRMVQANRTAAERRLTQVRGALRRMDEGEYGVCVTCGEEIGYRRLEAKPEAPFCLACQSAREVRD